uniref:PCI domain-containing protein n=1 Tax=Meloidogyne incognita TaxID=6306 RepID=A0A914L6B0_MELIC
MSLTNFYPFLLKVWNLFRNSDNVKKVLISRIQEETLRTYLLMYSTIYSTVLLTTLCDQFQLSRQRIYAIISKMILQEELSAKFDESTDCLIMHKVEPSKLQLLSLQAAEKFSQVSSIEQTGGSGGGGGPTSLAGIMPADNRRMYGGADKRGGGVGGGSERIGGGAFHRPQRGGGPGGLGGGGGEQVTKTRGRWA